MDPETKIRKFLISPPSETELRSWAEERHHQAQDLREALKKYAENLQSICHRIEAWELIGVKRMYEVYDVRCSKFENMVPPPPFEELVTTLQWLSVEEAVRHLEFEQLYSFLFPLIETNKNLFRTLVRAKRLQKEQVKSYTGEGNLGYLEYEEKVLFSLKRSSSEMMRDCEQAQRVIKSHVETLQYDRSLVEGATLQEYLVSSEEKRDHTTRCLFEQAMSTDEEAMDKSVYTTRMRAIRALWAVGSVEEVEKIAEELETLNKVLGNILNTI